MVYGLDGNVAQIGLRAFGLQLDATRGERASSSARVVQAAEIPADHDWLSDVR